MEKDKIIGIVGGMGPHAGYDLAAKILEHTIASADQDHLPVALLSYPERIPDRATFLFGEAPDHPGCAIARIVEQLERVGAVVAAIPCNTAHAPPIFDHVQQSIAERGGTIELVSIIDATVAEVERAFPAGTPIGILGTTAVYELRLYADALEAAGYPAVMPDPAVQETSVNQVIYNPGFGLKAQSQPVTREARERLLGAISHLKAHGARAVILGCTELPLALPEPTVDDLPLVDPTVLLARALIAATYPEALVPAP